MTAVDFTAFVERLADLASATILPFFRTSLGSKDKNVGGMFDPVTEADHAAEAALRRVIQDTFPNHGIIGEEFGSIRADADYVWVLDPIDGTKSFIAGLPTWGVLIGLLHRGRPTYGVMVQPFTRERFIGDGESAIWRGFGPDHKWTERKLSARICDDLGQATIITTSPLLFQPEKLEAFRRVEARARLSRYGGDCYAFAMLAAGHADCVVESGLQMYDIAALIPIIEGAGGIVTTWDGGSATGGGDIVACGGAGLHGQVLDLLRGD
ncbi:histidinol-phosphatase [Methylocapsa palsarum]|uniref:Histidinol-phosphatase n=1 Tax=Methylocapsa palsarum TaxID=1612308 RepID=A0A1I3Z8F7_9HYPH|nr:histidinol-phosphatase [Methylocapsa palsarum]SFK40312.1 myo-inositol-1(or 4)-monophosphatase [Methylocapsa palsarum]